MDRAKAGGEIGRNGEMYAGGQFLPNTDLGKRGGSGGKRGGARKWEIAPREWAEAPEGKIAIWGTISDLGVWRGGTWWPCPRLNSWRQFGPTNTEKLKGLIRRWINGERWMSSEDWIRAEPDDNYNYQTGWKPGTGPETW